MSNFFPVVLASGEPQKQKDNFVMRGGEEDCFVLLIAAGDVKTNISLQSVLSIVQGRHCNIIPHTPPSCNHSNIYQTTNINLSCRLCQLDVLWTCDLIRNNRGGQHSVPGSIESPNETN